MATFDTMVVERTLDGVRNSHGVEIGASAGDMSSLGRIYRSGEPVDAELGERLVDLVLNGVTAPSRI